MQISKTTIDMLKNFATINQSIVINPGNKISTVSPQKSILAHADVEEDFPQTFGIYDLNRFLNVLSLVPDGELEFSENAVSIVSGKTKAQYNFADPSVITTPPKKKVALGTVDIEFTLKPDDLRSVLKAAGVYQLPEIAITSDGEKISLCAIDSNVQSSDTLSIDVGDNPNGATYRIVFKVENIRLMSRSYEVKASRKGLAHFATEGLEYYIAAEQKTSKYSEPS